MLFVLAIIAIGVAIALLVKAESRPWVIVGLLLALVGIIFPPAEVVAVICLIIGVVRLFV